MLGQGGFRNKTILWKPHEGRSILGLPNIVPFKLFTPFPADIILKSGPVSEIHNA